MSTAPDSTSGIFETTIEKMPSTSSPSESVRGAVGDALSREKVREKITKDQTVLKRPGRNADSWELWLFSQDREPELLPEATDIPQHCTHLVCLPSSALFSWPLWVASDGESLDLVRMELSGRHLLKRGMESSLMVFPVLERENRKLVLAVASEEPFPSHLMPADWKRASRFELPARLLRGSLHHDLIVWEEWDSLHMAFYRNQQPVWFCGARLQDLAATIHRISLRLLAEGVLEHLPSSILLDGLPEALAAQSQDSLRRVLPTAGISFSKPDDLVPLLPDYLIDMPPAEAREERKRIVRRQKFLSFAVVAGILYLLLLLWAAGDLFIRQNALKQLRHEIALVEQPALEAQRESSRWHALRPVIDPDTFALDLLAAAAAPTEGGKVRLTLFALEAQHLQLSGEAGDVSQAFSVIDQLKKNPLLQQFDWTASQPQLAGKSSVKFDMEGIRPEAASAASSATTTP